MLKSTLPIDSLLNNPKKKYDYIDSFEAVLNDVENNITIIDIGKAFFSSGPKWIDILFNVRNKIVAIFGLKTSGKMSDRKTLIENLKFEAGEQIGLFKVFDKTEHEIILGEDDKHLNFRVSLFLDQQKSTNTKKQLIISTTVTFNNHFGRLYFLPVRPFHQLIVPTLLKGMIKTLEKQVR